MISKEDFLEERRKLTAEMIKFSGKETKRFLSLDSQVYREGALDKQTKEMLGLVASIILRCDDCIRYHLHQCYELKIESKKIEEVFSIALVVGGSITIPHIRRAIDYWNKLFAE
ncbi:MAG: carboxymuconolactone decarboxylase family protein [Candidatus Cloacimonadota bacterium]|nr:carboxymuconolactone decarboxylase family protein [Candidatus Cloacimonadota bacterium]